MVEPSLEDVFPGLRDQVYQIKSPRSDRRPKLARLRQSVGRGIPFGSEVWVQQTAAAFGLGFTLRSRGRPQGRGRAEPGEEPGLFH